MFRPKIPLLLIVFSLFAISCDGLKMPKNIFDTSERAKYERRFSGSDSLMTNWKNDFASASTNKLKISDGFVMRVFTNDPNFSALGYSLDLKKGDQLVIKISPATEQKIFLDIFEVKAGVESSESEIFKNGKFSKMIENDGFYKIILQPEINFTGNFDLKIFTQPSLSFPVAGKGNRDVQSFWGADRDGGDRSHEGLDIFAARGTPVVAAADGFILRTGDQGLGGKQVWLREGIAGNSLYYAHLDSVMTESGNRVKVGNTGNAKGGATHLHFGIYSAGGAVDAYPFIRTRKVPSDLNSEITNFTKIKKGSNIRTGPALENEIAFTVPTEITAKILAGDGDWFHIKMSDGKEGFVNVGRLK